MIALEMGGVEVDHCLACGAIWLDSGELEMLCERPGVHDVFLDAFAKTPERLGPVRKCPICSTKMDEWVAPGGSPLIERCPKDGGWWFDSGELTTTLKVIPGGARSEVTALLTEIFLRQTKQQGEKA